MQRNAVWGILLLIIVLCALWFIVKAGMGIYRYTQLTMQVPVVIERWEIKEIKSDQFEVRAYYSFKYQGREYQGSGRIGDLYPNPWAASHAKEQFYRGSWRAWFNPKHPDHSLLEKKFPLKRMLSAVILVGLFIYFFILGLYHFPR
jgi:hypothetical protein